MEPPPPQQPTRHNHFCSRRQDGRRRHQGWRQEPQELGGVGGESLETSPCHPGDAKWAPQAEAIGNRGEEREGQGQAKQPDREPAKLRLVEQESSPCGLLRRLRNRDLPRVPWVQDHCQDASCPSRPGSSTCGAGTRSPRRTTLAFKHLCRLIAESELS